MVHLPVSGTRNHMARGLHILLALFLALASTPLLKYGVSGLSHEYAARSWPTTKGVIKAASIRISEGRQTLWCPQWEYHFQVSSGRSYASTRTTFGVGSCERSRQLAEEKLRSLPINSLVDVIYDPANPSYSALYVSDDRGFLWWVVLCLGAALLALGVFYGFRAFRKPVHGSLA